jgi:hypothetical protein
MVFCATRSGTKTAIVAVSSIPLPVTMFQAIALLEINQSESLVRHISALLLGHLPHVYPNRQLQSVLIPRTATLACIVAVVSCRNFIPICGLGTAERTNLLQLFRTYKVYKPYITCHASFSSKAPLHLLSSCPVSSCIAGSITFFIIIFASHSRVVPF